MRERTSQITMRDGWLKQEDLMLQSELLQEEDLARQLVETLDAMCPKEGQTAREALTAIAARARALLLWLDRLIFEMPTTVLVTGGPSTGKSSFIADLVDGQAVYAADADTSGNKKLYGYRPIARTAGGWMDSVTPSTALAECVEQTQRANERNTPAQFSSQQAMWVVDYVQLIEISDIASACGVSVVPRPS